jgi:hypothetical protein
MEQNDIKKYRKFILEYIDLDAEVKRSIAIYKKCKNPHIIDDLSYEIVFNCASYYDVWTDDDNNTVQSELIDLARNIIKYYDSIKSFHQ